MGFLLWLELKAQCHCVISDCFFVAIKYILHYITLRQPLVRVLSCRRRQKFWTVYQLASENVPHCWHFAVNSIPFTLINPTINLRTFRASDWFVGLHCFINNTVRVIIFSNYNNNNNNLLMKTLPKWVTVDLLSACWNI